MFGELTAPLDVGLRPQHDQSYYYFMWDNLFKRTRLTLRSSVS